MGTQVWEKCLTTDSDTTSVEVTGDSVPYEADFRFRVCCVNKYGRSGHVEFPKPVHLGKCNKCQHRESSCITPRVIL